MDDRNAEQLLYIDATLAEMNQLTSRGRRAYDADIAVARACAGPRPASRTQGFVVGDVEAA